MFNREEYILLDEDLQAKEVYAFLGLTIFYFQVLESQLMNMILIKAKAENINLKTDEYDNIFRNYSDKTLGKLIDKILEIYKLNNYLTNQLRSINKKRNYYAHHYFKDWIHRLYSTDGRVETNFEFERTLNKVKEIDKKLEYIIEPLKLEFGITEEYLSEKIREFKDGLNENEELRYDR